MVNKLIEGLRYNEIQLDSKSHPLVEKFSKEDALLLNPLPNFYFQRDPFASIGKGVTIHNMYSATRKRETIFAEYIFKYHPDFIDTPIYYDRYQFDTIEGGDILNLNEHTIAIGISERTSPEAIEKVAKSFFEDPDCLIDTVLGFIIPKSRAFMHLDTVFTQVDYDKFTIHPAILGPLKVYKLTYKEEKVNIEEIHDSLEHILSSSLGLPKVELLPCGGGDLIAAAREQWNDGSNTLCIAPGKVIAYDRNEVTNNYLRKNGIEVIEVPSSELSRGRGGPRCMTMPLKRE